VQWLTTAPATRRIFILDEAMGECVDKAKATRIGHANRRDYWLFGADAVVTGCVPKPATDDDP